MEACKGVEQQRIGRVRELEMRLGVDAEVGRGALDEGRRNEQCTEIGRPNRQRVTAPPRRSSEQTA